MTITNHGARIPDVMVPDPDRPGAFMRPNDPLLPLTDPACEDAEFVSRRPPMAEPPTTAPAALEALEQTAKAVIATRAAYATDGEPARAAWLHAAEAFNHAVYPEVVLALRRSRDAWREYAEHLEGCVTCGETSADDCWDGGQLRAAARSAATPAGPVA